MTEVEMLDGIARKMRKHGLDDFPYSTRLKAAQAALAAIRDTHAIVPREPTGAMVEAGAVERCGWATTAECADMRKCYKAMIAAAEGEG